MKKQTLLLFAFIIPLAITACSNDEEFEQPEFELSAEAEDLTGGYLSGWIADAPFDELFDPYADADSDQLVFDNTSALFPYIGQFIGNDGADTEYSSDEPSPVYQDTADYYNDPDWGPVAVYAAFLYETDPVWLEDFHTINTVANRMAHGSTLSGRGRPKYLRLHQTGIKGTKERYRTAVYRGYNPLSGSFLLAFHQQGQVVFETAFRCPARVLTACLDKLNDIAEQMGLDVPEWQQAEAEDLEKTDAEDTFWDAQFETLREGDDDTAAIAARTVDSDYALQMEDEDHFRLSREVDSGKAMLEFRVKDTNQSREAFVENAQGLEYWRYPNNIFLTAADAADDGVMTGRARVHVGRESGRVLEIVYRYPGDDEQAGDELRALITSLQIDKS